MYVYNNNDVEFIFSICGFMSEGGVLWGKGEGDRQVLYVFKNIFCFTIFLVFYCIPKIVCNKMDFLYFFSHIFIVNNRFPNVFVKKKNKKYTFFCIHFGLFSFSVNLDYKVLEEGCVEW